jgi:hypothetical protein
MISKRVLQARFVMAVIVWPMVMSTVRTSRRPVSSPIAQKTLVDALWTLLLMALHVMMARYVRSMKAVRVAHVSVRLRIVVHLMAPVSWELVSKAQELALAYR